MNANRVDLDVCHSPHGRFKSSFLSARLLEPIIEFNYRVFLKVKACALSGIMQLSSYPNDGDLFSADAKKVLDDCITGD